MLNKYMNTKVISLTKGWTATLLTIALLLLTLPLMVSAEGGPAGKVKGGKNVDATCMAAAVDVREEALMEAWETMSADTLEALTERKAALHSAWDLTDSAARNKAVATAWKTWKTDKKEIATEFRNDRKAAWAAFKTTAKASCKVTTPKEEGLEKAESDSIAI